MRLNVVLEEALAGFEGGRSEFDFDIVFHPDLQPTTHGVGFRPPIVDADVFLDGFLQLFFYFRLRFSEDIFDDGLASFRIVTDGVPALPSSVLSFEDSSLIA